MVRLHELSSPVISAPLPCAGRTAETTRVATSATTESPRQVASHPHRTRRTTEAAQPGCSPCTSHTASTTAGIAAAQPMLTSARNDGVISSVPESRSSATSGGRPPRISPAAITPAAAVWATRKITPTMTTPSSTHQRDGRPAVSRR